MKRNDEMLARNVVNMTNMCAKKEIISFIKKKNINVVNLANEMNMSVDKFNSYMNMNVADVSFYMNLLVLVKSWEG